MALKVYRTPIGFHDAYVAAPSQKAALKAWGSDANLFARGVAEVVTDPTLTKEPLAHPGEVIRRLRGTADEQLAAAPAKAKKPAKTTPAKPKKPRPSRKPLDRAEAALAAAETKHQAAERRLVEDERRLADKRKALRAAWIAERDALETKLDEAEEEYSASLKRWQEA